MCRSTDSCGRSANAGTNHLKCYTKHVTLNQRVQGSILAGVAAHLIFKPSRCNLDAACGAWITAKMSYPRSYGPIAFNRRLIGTTTRPSVISRGKLSLIVSAT
jgi:hypothetical protein